MTDTVSQNEDSNNALESSSRLDSSEAIQKIIEEDQPVFTTLGLAQKDIEALYVTVKNLYDREKYQEALPLFKLFAFYDSRDIRAWMGLGACCEKLSDYPYALLSYQRAAGLDSENPLPHFRMAYCWLAGKKTPQALEALAVSIRLSAGNQKYVKLHETALHLTQSLSRA